MKNLVKKSNTLLLCVVFVFGACNARPKVIEEFYKDLNNSNSKISILSCENMTKEVLQEVCQLLKEKSELEDPNEQMSIVLDAYDNTLLTVAEDKEGGIIFNIGMLEHVYNVLVSKNRLLTHTAHSDVIVPDVLEGILKKVFEAYETCEDKEFQEKCKEALERLNTLEEQRILTKEVTKNNSSSSVGVSTYTTPGDVLCYIFVR